MKILIVHPGSSFSTADLYEGWSHALLRAGVQVGRYNLHERLAFYGSGRWPGGQTLEEDNVYQLAAAGLMGICYEYDPDIVLVISAAFVPGNIFDLWKKYRQRLVLLLTESPYEDDRQLRIVEYAEPELVLLNDPTNIDRYPSKTVYMPHAHDPYTHRWQPSVPVLESDFCFVGTDYPSRIDFLEQVDWKDLDVKLAGNWTHLDEKSNLFGYVENHDLCIDNSEAAKLYASTKVSANLYRGAYACEAERPEHQKGWAVGPREVELAACSTFFLREPRGEGDELFPMLPRFDTPEEFTELLHWWTAHDKERITTAGLARAVIQDRTFDNNARRLLELLPV